MASILGDSKKNRTEKKAIRNKLESGLGEMYENSYSEFVIGLPYLSNASSTLLLRIREAAEASLCTCHKFCW